MYKIRFADIDGTLHDVGVGDTGEEKILKGATDAFQVSEDDSTDMFTPVRTQSGYLTFVDSDGEWESLIPAPGSYMPVALDPVTDGQGTSTWSGWVATPESGFPYMEVNPDVKIPVMCPLSLLETFDFYPVSGRVALYVISELIAQIGYIYFANTGKWLNLGPLPTGCSDLATYRVSTSVFFDIDSEGETSAKYNCLEALQEICTFLGVTARWTGNAVVFEGADSVTAGASVEASFADVNQEQGYYQGFREVAVSPNHDEADNTYEIPGKKILNDILAEENVPTTETIEEDEHGDGRFARIAGTKTGIVKGENVDTTLTSSSTYPSASVLVYEYYEGRKNRDYTGNWLCGVKITEEDAGSNPCAIFETYEIISLYYTAIEITADVAEHYTPLDKEVEGYLIAELKVGNYYFTGRSWSTTEQQFNLYFNKKISGPKLDSTIKEGLYARARGFSKISGKITLRIYGYKKTDAESVNDSHLILSNFKIELENLYPDYLKGKEEIFKIKNGTKFRDKKEISTIFCSAVKTSNVTNCIYNDEGEVVDTITIGTYTGKPEMWLAQRVSNYSARKRHFLRLNLKGNISNLAAYTAGSRDYHCYAASHDYAENITTLNLIEI